jgi:sarcosine oxidase subunit alpha
LASPESAPFSFTFNGKPIEAQPGDSVGAALFRSGVRVFSRSFKSHRPRGLLCVAGRCPNCLMDVDGVPNVRACVTPARPGMTVKHQNAFPSLDFDLLAVNQKLGWLMPVGWYYKTFTNRRAWKAVEPWIRRAAGVGAAPPTIDKLPPRLPEYDHTYEHTEVAVVGGGPAGLTAAIEAAGRGRHVLLIDDQPELGGHLRYSPGEGERLQERLRQLKASEMIRTLAGATCFGLYEGNLLGVLQPQPNAATRERLVHVRARHVIVATGAYEAPLLFENNDLVGVMLSSAVERMMGLYDVQPGKRAVVIGVDPRAAAISSRLRAGGIEVAATVPVGQVVRAMGSGRVQGVRTRERDIPCDLLVVCGHLVPNAGLLHQAGARLEWDPSKGAFVPRDLPPNVSAAGEVTGEGLIPASPTNHTHTAASKKNFICLCEDVTTADVRVAIREGFDHIETLKRYTTVSMGPCQGRMCQISAIAVCADETGRTMGDTGVTTSRPPNPPVSLGALAGAHHPAVKRSPLHHEHEALGAVWMNMGQWKRPRYYHPDASLSERECLEQEYRAVRERVGVVDVGPLGKVDVKGRDAGKLLDKVYTHKFASLKVGRVRYAVICDDTGIVLDDGTISRLADDHYYITTTTGNLEFVVPWLEWWLMGTGWDAHVTNVTGGMASVNVAGPQAREVLSALTDVDLTTGAFRYMACRQGEVAGAPAILMRIGFVGEMGWEVHVPAEYGVRVWRAVLQAGKAHDVRPFGVEAQRMLRLEKKHVIAGVDTDALSNPFEADMAWVAKLDKGDFVGRASLERLQSAEMNERLIGFVMQDDGLPEDGAAVVSNGGPAGRVTSARYSPVNGIGVGLAWVRPELADDGQEIQVRVEGGLATARVQQAAFYDPEGKRLRM